MYTIPIGENAHWKIQFWNMCSTWGCAIKRTFKREYMARQLIKVGGKNATEIGSAENGGRSVGGRSAAGAGRSVPEKISGDNSRGERLCVMYI